MSRAARASRATVSMLVGVLVVAVSAEVPAAASISYGSPVTIASGLYYPNSVDVEPTGTVLIADTYNDRIVRVPAGGGAATTVRSGLNYPYGVAVDSAGNIYIADTGNSRVLKLPAGGGDETTVGTGLYQPFGVAADSAGNVFIADTGHNRVVKVPAGGGAQTDVGTGLNQPIDVAIDIAGNVFIADTWNGRVVKVAAVGGAQTTFASNISAYGVAVDAGSNVFVAGWGGVLRIPADGSQRSVLLTIGSQVPPFTPAQVDRPQGVAIDADGNVLVADTYNGRALKVSVLQPQLISFTSDPPDAAVVGDTYSVSATGGGSGNQVVFSIAPTSTSVCTVSGALVSFVAAGSCVIDADQGGTAVLYEPAPMAQQVVNVGRASQTVIFTSTSPVTAQVNDTYTATAEGGPSTSPVVFSEGSAASGTCSVSSTGSVTFLLAGQCVINADQAADANYTAAPRVTQTISVGAASQAVSFTSVPPTLAQVNDSYSVSAQGGPSTSPVVFSDGSPIPGTCSVTPAGSVTFIEAGQCVIDADQAADANYTAAPRVTQTIAVAQPTLPTASMTALRPFTLSNATKLSWQGSDAARYIVKYQLRYKAALYNGGYGAWAYPAPWQAFAPNVTTTSFTALAPGFTYCFAVRAQSHTGRWSAWTTARCTARALDDRSLATSNGWTRRTSTVWWNGTATTSSVKNAYLVRTGAQAVRLAVVATRCPTCGVISVRIGSTFVGNIGLYSTTTKHRQLIALPRFAYRTGTVVIQVLSSGKPVYIDGLAITRA